MRIALLADPLDTQYAGIKTFCEELIRTLISLDDGNEYFIIRAKMSDVFPEEIQYAVPIRKNIPGHARWRQFFAIPRLVKKLKADIAIELAHFGPFNLPRSIKRVTFIHDLTPIILPDMHPKDSVWAHKAFLPRILKKADLILCNSLSTKNDLEKYYPRFKNKYSSVSLGVNVKKEEQVNEAVLSKYGIDKKFLLHVGTLEPRKNLTRLVRAFNHIKNDNHDLQLVLCGKSGWKNESLTNEINVSKYSDDIIHCGFVPENELTTFYKSALGFVYPSLYEGFGLPVLEAMNYGCPLIISNSSSLPEEIIGVDRAMVSTAAKQNPSL